MSGPVRRTCPVFQLVWHGAVKVDGDTFFSKLPNFRKQPEFCDCLRARILLVWTVVEEIERVGQAHRSNLKLTTLRVRKNYDLLKILYCPKDDPWPARSLARRRAFFELAHAPTTGYLLCRIRRKIEFRGTIFNEGFKI